MLNQRKEDTIIGMARSLTLSLGLCFGILTFGNLPGFDQGTMASCDPPPESPKQPPKK